MRLTQARIEPVQDQDLTDEQREVLDSLKGPRGGLLTFYRTLAHAPKALHRFTQWGAYVLSRRNSLPPRQREILILRVGYLCRSGYEFAQHTRIGLREGLSAEDIARIKSGADAGWSADEAALIRAADELVTDHFIANETWQVLRAHFDEKQCMDAVFTVGQYTQVAMFLNTFGVQPEPGQDIDPDLSIAGR
jgi:4-carboxymuconolactone decarboxylase